MDIEEQIEERVALLVAAYKDAMERIYTKLLSMDLTEMSRKNTAAVLAEVARILTGLNVESAAWVAEVFPEVTKESVAETILRLGKAESIEDARLIAKFNRMNSNFVASVVADTQADLLAVTQNVDRRVRATVRKVTADSMRANMSAGINGRRTINRDTLAGMRRELGSAIDTGIIDSSGRRWQPSVYVDMVTRTKIHETSRETRANEAVSRGAYYARISSHNAKDACRKYEGMIVKLTPDAPGDYPYIGDLPRNEIFHPCCKHTILPMRDPDRI